MHAPIKRGLRAIALLAIIFLSCAFAMAQSNTITYTIPIFRQEQALTDPINQRSYWFELRPGVQLAGNPSLHIVYLYSQTILPGQGSFTVVVNTVPVASRQLSGNPGVANTWDVPISSGLLKPGFNEIRITTRQRSIEGFCRDIDNDANWVRLTKQTTLTLTREALAGFELRTYPFPNLDYLATNAANATLTLPGNPTEEEVRTMAETAANWGLREPFLKLPLRAATTLPTTGDALIFGTYARWPQFFPDGAPAGTDKNYVTRKNTGYLASRWGDGGVHVFFSGKDATGMQRASLFMTDPEAVAQLETSEMVIPSDRVISAVKPVTHAAGRYTFSDLGATMQQLQLSGAFHQATSLVLTRPVREKIGRESYVKIYFRHSAALNPRRSMLTITVNGRKIGSVALTKNNILGGSVTAPLPIQELDADQWNIGILVYHDLGTLDCSKRYDEVAWTTIEGHSFVLLAPGRVPGYPTLANFPTAMTNTGKPVDPITLWLPKHPSDAMLSAAAVIAARAGQANHVPLRWHVVMNDGLPISARSRVVIMLAARDDKKRLGAVRSLLPVWPGPDGFSVREGLKVVPESWRDPLILEAVETKWDKQGVLYAVIGASDNAFDRLAKKLTDPETLQNLGAQIAVFTPESQFAFTTIDPEARRRLLDQEMNRYTWPMQVVIALFILLLLGFIMRMVWMLRKRPGKKDEGDAAAGTVAAAGKP